MCRKRLEKSGNRTKALTKREAKKSASKGKTNGEETQGKLKGSGLGKFSVNNQWYLLTTMLYVQIVPEPPIFCQWECNVVSNVH